MLTKEHFSSTERKCIGIANEIKILSNIDKRRICFMIPHFNILIVSVSISIEYITSESYLFRGPMSLSNHPNK